MAMLLGEQADRDRTTAKKSGAFAVSGNDKRGKDRRMHLRSTDSHRGTPLDSAFDSWLKGRLQDMFGDAAHEPIPREMLNLLQAKPERE
jgi:hypothetical protein